MVKEYFFLYLIYGFAMINMGMFCVKEKNINSNDLYLVKSLKYLGYFGITHGISEWLTMINVVDLYVSLYIHIFNINQILKAVSFALLLYFGLDLIQCNKKYKKFIIKLPSVLLLINITGYIYIIKTRGLDYHIINSKYNIITMRYLLALTSGLITAAGLFINANIIKKTKSIEMSRRYNSLAWIFIIYGVLEGLFVSKDYFLPANLISKNLFQEVFNFPALAVKAVVGLIINYLLMKVIDTFRWEQEVQIKKLEKHRIASEERRKLGLEIHDGIIQSLYAAGLKIEFLMLNNENNKSKNLLEEVRNDLNNTIDKTREFLSSSSLNIIEMDDLKYSLEQLVMKFRENQNINIKIKFNISPLNNGYLSPEKINSNILYSSRSIICSWWWSIYI